MKEDIPSMMIDSFHQVVNTLGIGGAGEVYSIRNVKDNTMFAAKFARKDLKVTKAKKLLLLQRERDTMEELNGHPNILSSFQLLKRRKAHSQKNEFEACKRHFGVHLTTAPYHMIEYCENGSFISYLRNQDSLPENITCYYADQLISAIHFIHNKGYAHLDIKLDNILLDNYFNIRLSDFGSALKINDQPFTSIRRGTTKYMAPEVRYLQEEETFDAYKADMYSLGICLFLMLFKRFPVYVEDIEYPETVNLFNENETLEACPFDCDIDIWKGLSIPTKRILLSLLNEDPSERPYINQFIEFFRLPILDESITEVIFDEMQARRTKYEEDSYEKKFIQPAACSKNLITHKNCNKAKEVKTPSNKSGSSTNVTN
ncbi:unnamed protein product [Moneuplotes crassus]|uniref:Protein kinase domain-containing protein n=1 Tax=Euplotes crassus TaxID=5936 RepID=A0AAD1XFV3_EUPCR|nr:unnamed protein product [Moneuplotes crassus]